MKKFCLALDLKEGPVLIQEYEEYHKRVWPEVLDSIEDSGIQRMEIYRVENRLFMIIETDEDFSFQKKDKLDAGNKRVQDWEELMWKYQLAIPNSKPGEKWRLMKQIFEFEKES